MLQSNLCNYSDALILLKETIRNTGGPANATDANKRLDKRDKKVIFKNCAPFTDCKSEINDTRVDTAEDLDIMMPMYNLIEYSDKYSQTSVFESLWKFMEILQPNATIRSSESFKSKVKKIGSTPNDGNKNDVKLAVSLKYLSNFWRALEISLILTWSAD